MVSARTKMVLLDVKRLRGSANCASIATALVTALIAFGPGRAAHAQDVVVFAASSLTNALDEAAKLFEREGGAHAKISYAASSALAKQIESGAPADLFISADLDWMNYLEQRHLIQPAIRRNLLGKPARPGRAGRQRCARRDQTGLRPGGAAQARAPRDG
jgi:hypothetical protein